MDTQKIESSKEIFVGLDQNPQRQCEVAQSGVNLSELKLFHRTHACVLFFLITLAPNINAHGRCAYCPSKATHSQSAPFQNLDCLPQRLF